MTEFGWTNPIPVGADNDIIARHARLLAAQQLGMSEVPVIQLGHLSEAVYLCPFLPGVRAGAAVRISLAEGTGPLWRNYGKELFCFASSAGFGIGWQWM